MSFRYFSMFNSRSLNTPPEIQTNRGTTLLTKHATRARVLFPDKTIVKHTEHWRKKQDLTQPVFPLLVLVGKDSSQLLATYVKLCLQPLATRMFQANTPVSIYDPDVERSFSQRTGGPLKPMANSGDGRTATLIQRPARYHGVGCQRRDEEFLVLR